MKNGRISGEYHIIAEMLKYRGNTLTGNIKLFILCLDQGKLPSSWGDAEVILIYKKGDCEDIGNYRPVSLPTIF